MCAALFCAVAANHHAVDNLRSAVLRRLLSFLLALWLLSGRLVVWRLPIIRRQLLGNQRYLLCGLLLFRRFNRGHLQRLRLLSAGNIVGLQQLIGAIVQIGFLIFDLVDADGHGVQRRRAAKVKGAFLRHLFKLLLARFFALQYLADKLQLVVHFTDGAQLEQQLVLQHHLDI